MDSRDLHYFVVICESKSLSAASTLVGRSQPALSKCINRLETELGTRLFERDGRGLKLTAVGQVLLERARFLNAAVDEVVHELHDLSSGIAGSIRLGHTSSVIEPLLPSVLNRLRVEGPNISIKLSMGLNDELRAWLRAGHVDYILGPLQDSDREFKTLSITDDVVVVAAYRTHPLFATPKVELKDLARYMWALPPRGISTREWLDTRFAAANLPLPTVSIEYGMTSLMPSLLADTDILTFMSRDLLRQNRSAEGLRELPVPELMMRRRLGLIHRPTGHLSPAALLLFRVVESMCGPQTAVASTT